MPDRVRTWSFAQWALLVLSALHVAQAIAGFVAEPSFATGPDAPTAVVLGMDYNGWHALAGLLLFGPGLFFATRPSWAVAYLLLAGVAGALPGVWALFSHQVAYVFTFPNNTTDAIVHFVTGGVMLLVAAVQIRLDGGWRASLGELLSPRGSAGRTPRPGRARG